MSDLTFKCQKCGTCCRGLFVEEFGMLQGLCLSEEEAKQFDPKFIMPYIAIGDKEPATIVYYQLILADCPHLNDKNECKIYDKRPLICRVFPVHPDLNHTVILPKCPQIEKHWSREEKICPVAIEDDEIEGALTKINIRSLTHRKECLEKGLRFWYFDLAKKEWRRSEY